MRLLYTIGIWFYGLGIRVAALFNEKARLWVRGRKDLFSKLEQTFAGKQSPVWVHSPSGYTQGIKDNLSDYVFYLPLDLPGHARRFLDIVKPRTAVFVKYEFWYNFMQQLQQKSIPFYYISAIFREKQHFFKPGGRWFAKQLRQATHFFVQTEKSKELLENIDIKQVTVCGDTRFDRVKAIAAQVQPFDFMETFRQDKKVIVAGSTWGPDEQLLAQLLQDFPEYKLVVAPHEISRTPEVKQTFAAYKTALYSSKEESNLSDAQVFIIDTIGILNRLYQYSAVSYIGGAFKTGSGCLWKTHFLRPSLRPLQRGGESGGAKRSVLCRFRRRDEGNNDEI